MRTAATRQPRRPRDGRNQNQGVNAAFPFFVVQGPGEQELECNDPWDSRILSLEDLARSGLAEPFEHLVQNCQFGTPTPTCYSLSSPECNDFAL